MPPELSKKQHKSMPWKDWGQTKYQPSKVICVVILCKCIVTDTVICGGWGRVYKMKSTGFRIRRLEHNCSLGNVSFPKCINGTLPKELF